MSSIYTRLGDEMIVNIFATALSCVYNCDRDLGKRAENFAI